MANYLPFLLAGGLLISTQSHAAFAEPVHTPTVIWQSFNSLTAPDATVAMGTDGSAIVLWKSVEFGQSQLFSQRFSATGVAVSQPIDLSAHLPITGEIGKVVARITNDNVATVAWEIVRANDAGDIQKVRIGQDGVPLSAPVTVNTQTDGAQVNPAIASDALDHVVISWTSPIENNRHGAFAQIYNRAGGRQFGEFRVDESGASAPLKPIVLMGECCGIQIAWAKQEDNASSYGIYARNFILAGQEAGPETLLSSMPAANAPGAMAAGVDFEKVLRIAWTDPSGAIQMLKTDENLLVLQPPTTLQTNAVPTASSALWLGVSRSGEFALAWKTVDVQAKADARSVLEKDVLARFDAQSIPMEEKLLSDFEAPDTLSNSAYAMDSDGDIAVVRTKAHQWSPELSLTFGRHGGIPNAQHDLSLNYSATAVADSVFQVTVTVRNLAFPNFSGGNPDIGIQTGLSVRFQLDPNVEALGANSGEFWECDFFQAKLCRLNALNAGATSTLNFYLRAPLDAQQLRNVFSLTALETKQSGISSAEAVIQMGDSTPDTLSITDQTDVPLSAQVVSVPVLFSGFNLAVPISVVGGEYSINGGPFSADQATVLVTDVVRVRHLSASNYGATVNTVLTIGELSDTFSSTTMASDVTPDAFSFTDLSAVTLNTLQVSNQISISGINAPSPISIAGGEYQLNGGNFTAAAGVVNAGDLIRVRHTSGIGFSQSVNTTLSVGGVTDTFSSTTLAQDSTPNAFSFVDQNNLATGILVISAPISVTGFNVPVSISIAGGSFSINGAPFASAAGTINPGDQVRVRVQSANSANTPSNVSLTIGGVSDTFTATTGNTDTTPAAFSFLDVTGARVARSITSGSVILSGFNAPVAITVSGNAVAYSKNGGTFTAVPGTVVSGDQIRLRMNSSSTANTAVTATVSIGGVSDEWKVTTGNR